MGKRYRGITKQAINIRYIFFNIYVLSLLFSENKAHAEVKDIDYANVIRIERENKDFSKTGSVNYFKNKNSTVNSSKFLENVNMGNEQGEITLNFQKQRASNLPHNSSHTQPFFTLNNPYEENNNFSSLNNIYEKSNQFSSLNNISSRLADMDVTGKENLQFTAADIRIENLHIRETGELTVFGTEEVVILYNYIENLNSENGKLIFFLKDNHIRIASFSGNLSLLKIVGDEKNRTHNFYIYPNVSVTNLDLESVTLNFNANLVLSADNINISGKVHINMNEGIDIKTKNLTITEGNLSFGNGVVLENISFIGTSSFMSAASSSNLLNPKNINIEEGDALITTYKPITSENMNFSGSSSLALYLGNANLIWAEIEITNLNIDGDARISNASGDYFNGKFSVTESINLKDNSSLILDYKQDTGIYVQNINNINLGDNTTLKVFSTSLNVGNGGINVKGNSTINVDSTISTKNLNIEGDATLSGTGNLNITENINLTGTSSLSLNKIVTTKNLNIEGDASLSGTAGLDEGLKVTEKVTLGNNSTLTLNNFIETKGIRLGEDTTLVVNGLLDVGDGGINVEGISTINIDSTINTASIDINNNGNLKISGTGNINVTGSLNINEGLLDLTSTRTDMLQNIGINNVTGVLEVGINQLSLKEYKGNIDSQINIKLADSTSGKLNLSNSFQVTDGIFNINTEGLINYQEGTRYEIVTANSIDLQGDNLFISDDVKYQLVHEIIDGKTIEVSFAKTNILCTKGEVSDYCNIAGNLQNAIDNDLGNEKFNKDLSVIIADTQNREYNILQLKPISNTTKKEINSIISGEFNNLVMDRMYSYNLNKNKKIYNFVRIYRGFLDRKNNTSEGLQLWSSLGHSTATVKGESLGGLKEGKEGIQTNQAAIGIDYATENTLIGIAGSFGSISSKNKEEIERYQVKGRSYSGGIYVGYKEEYFYVNNNISYTTINNDSTRYINMPLNPKENQAVSRDRVISIMNESGIGDDIGSYMRFNMFVTGKYEDYTLSGYEEKGTGFALSLEEKTYKDSKVGGGIRIIGNNILNPMIEVAYERRLNKDSLKGEMSFANASSGIIEITEDTYSQDKIKVGAGINIDIEYVGNGSLNFGVRGQQEFNKEVNNFSGSVNISYNF